MRGRFISPLLLLALWTATSTVAFVPRVSSGRVVSSSESSTEPDSDISATSDSNSSNKHDTECGISSKNNGESEKEGKKKRLLNDLWLVAIAKKCLNVVRNIIKAEAEE